MKRTKQEKGITLVALIITIIVLLILAVVAINAVQNDGIIEYAKNARNTYEEAQKNEQSLLEYYETYIQTEGQKGKWVQNKTKLTRVNSDGTVDKLEVGDLIKNYKSSTNEAIEWKVLGVENGKVLLVSSTNVATETLNGRADYIDDVGINRLNAIGANYDDGIGAVEGSGRSINIKDIDRVTGYNPLKTGTGEPYYNYTWNNENKRVTQYMNKVTYTINAEGKVCFSSDLASGVSTLDAQYQKYEHVDGTKLVKESEYTEAEGTAKSITVESNLYGYYPVSLSLESDTSVEVKGISAESNAYKLLFEGTETEEKKYWLGSSYLGASVGYVDFGVRGVFNGCVGGGRLWRSCVGAYSVSRGVRAVVTLQSDIQFTNAGENTYNISVPE